MKELLAIESQKKKTTEELLQEILKGQSTKDDKVEKIKSDVTALTKYMKMLEGHMGQIASSSNSNHKSVSFRVKQR